MKVQQTFDFILISQIIIAFGAIVAILWSFIRNVNFIPFLLLLLASIFILVTVYISNNKINKLQIDKSTCVLSIFIIWLVLIVMGAIPLYLIFPDENIKDIIFLTISLVSTNGVWTEIEYSNVTSFLIWQSILQWLGGLCTIIIGSFLLKWF